MPVYTYRCENCNNQFDQQQSFSEEPLNICPECKKRALRKIYRPAQVLFKGSGYYVTDNRSSSKSRINNSKDSSSSDNGKSEKKSEAKTEKKETKKKST
jgi:putative FmdB family regulatory protein